MEWRFIGDLRGTQFAPRRLPVRHMSLDFVLRLRDVPRRYFGDGPQAGPEMDLIGELAECDGLVYLFDPTREAYSADSYAYFETVTTRLTRRVAQQGRLVDGQLLHRFGVHQQVQRAVRLRRGEAHRAGSRAAGQRPAAHPGPRCPALLRRDLRLHPGTAETVRDATWRTSCRDAPATTPPRRLDSRSAGTA